VVIRLLEGRLAWYPPGANDQPRWLQSEDADDSLESLQGQRRLPLYFAVPGENLRLLQIPISPEEKKHIARSLPFMLEEVVAEDIANLHFVAGNPEDEELPVAICARQHMEAWQDLLSRYPGISQWVPEPLLLPWQEGEWCLLFEPDRALVRLGQCSGFSIERDSLSPLLQAALREDSPKTLVLYGADQEADLAALPVDLHEKVQWRRGSFYTAMMLSGDRAPALNLLQGNYAHRLPLARWWLQWRAVAAVFAVGFLLQVAATYMDYLGLKRENLALRSAVEQSYRQANPRGNMTDAEKQLQRQLQGLRGLGQSAGFVSLMSRVGSVIAGQPGTRIATINYSDRGGEMRMNILAGDYEAVERVRAEINKAGLSAVMESSSAQGDKVRARLRIGDKS
jgi:type II secretion system protein L